MKQRHLACTAALVMVLALQAPVAFAKALVKELCPLERIEKTLLDADPGLKSVWLHGKTPETASAFFAEKVIRFSPEQTRATGIVKITKLAELGEGGMGQVFEVEVEDVHGGTRRMAWKQIKDFKGIESDPEILEEIKQLQTVGVELQHLAAGDHVVPVRLRVAALDDHLNILAEGDLFEKGGPSASKLMGRGGVLSLRGPDGELKATSAELGFSIRAIARAVRDMASDVTDLAAQKIVHRDIKPHNFVIYGSEKNTVEDWLAGRAKLRVLDFDLGISMGKEVPENLLGKGTPAYAAPDILGSNEPQGEPANDAYSIAASAYRMLSGESGFIYDHDGAVEGLKKLETELRVKKGVSEEDMLIFNDMYLLVKDVMEMFTETRKDLLKKTANPILSTTQSGELRGPLPVFLRRLPDEALPPGLDPGTGEALAKDAPTQPGIGAHRDLPTPIDATEPGMPTITEPPH